MSGIDPGLGWLLAVNLVLWTGLFLYVLRLHRQVRAAESAADAQRR
jgi:CcmD family protein